MAAGRGGRNARHAAGWLGWVGVLLGVALGGSALGRGPLAPPPVTDPTSWAAWASGRAPLESVFAVLGLLVVVLAWYLLVVTLLAVAARLWGITQLVTVVEILTVPVVRRSVHTALGIGLVGAGVAGGASAVAPDRPAPAVAIVASPVAAVAMAEPGAERDETTDDDDDADDDDADEADPPVMRLLPEDLPGEVDVTPAPASALTSEPTATEWKVRPGDHLWSVAARVLEEAGVVSGGGDDDVAPYWRRLIEANTDRLADPANPDLIYPGQVLTLPTPSPPGERALP